jgi:hypothetical protein
MTLGQKLFELCAKQAENCKYFIKLRAITLQILKNPQENTQVHNFTC